MERKSLDALRGMGGMDLLQVLASCAMTLFYIGERFRAGDDVSIFPPFFWELNLEHQKMP